jgi:hypothetical protein
VYRERGLRAILIAALILTVASIGVSAGATRSAPFQASGLEGGPARFQDRILTGKRLPASALASRFWGGTITASDGEKVAVQVSDSYPADPAFPQSIADFLVQLYHGAELQDATLFIFSPDELVRICGSAESGCYDPRTKAIFAPGTDLPGGVSRETFLAHEYGHHVANSRSNPPWPALSWGPKRWATTEDVCARKRQGTAFPGDLGDHYHLNPGEAWAETYRLLNFQKTSWPTWQFTPFQADQSFAPDTTAFAAAKADVLQPWTAPTQTTLSGRLAPPKTTRVLRRRIATPLDGLVTVRLGRAPLGTTVALESPTGAVLRRPGKRVTYTACGARSLVVVVRATRPGAFAVGVSKP